MYEKKGKWSTYALPIAACIVAHLAWRVNTKHHQRQREILILSRAEFIISHVDSGTLMSKNKKFNGNKCHTCTSPIVHSACVCELNFNYSFRKLLNNHYADTALRYLPLSALSPTWSSRFAINKKKKPEQYCGKASDEGGSRQCVWDENGTAEIWLTN